MFFYHQVSNETRPAPTLEVTSEVWVTEWRRCWEDPESDLTYLLEISKPFIDYWNQQLTNPQEYDINLISLYRLLNNKFETSLELIKTWISEVSDNGNTNAELTYLFIEHVRSANYFPTKAQPLIAEYVIVSDFKRRIKYGILKVNQSYHRNNNAQLIPSKQYHTDTYPDWFLINNLNLDKWQQYLLKLIETGKTTLDMARITHIPRETFYYEEKKLWHLLKKSYLTHEI